MLVETIIILIIPSCTFDGYNQSSQHVTIEEIAPLGRGDDIFLPHTFLPLEPPTNPQYLKNDQLHFRVSHVTLYSSAFTNISPHWCLHSPTTFITQLNMTEFSKHKSAGDEWCSNKFYTHKYGYCVCLRVHANGFGPGQGSHVGVCIRLVKGQYDDQLTWPFTGAVTIQLLNWYEDKHHRTDTINLADPEVAITSKSRVLSGDIAPTAYGNPQFISHNELYHPHSNIKYIDNDCLVFRIVSVNF